MMALGGRRTQMKKTQPLHYGLKVSKILDKDEGKIDERENFTVVGRWWASLSGDRRRHCSQQQSEGEMILVLLTSIHCTSIGGAMSIMLI